MNTKQVKTLPDGFVNRGESMDRLETFVAAAFAFAVTTLIISVGQVPASAEEFVQAIKLIPSFAASFAIIVWIWSTHANWCRRYGLEDRMAVLLSALLVFLVLIYIFPLRIMMQGLFSALSGGYFPSDMRYETISQVRLMFAFYGAGFLALALNFIGLFKYALSVREEIDLSPWEIYQTTTEIQAWSLVSAIAVLAFLSALLMPFELIGFSGYIYFLLFPVLLAHGVFRKRNKSLVPDVG